MRKDLSWNDAHRWHRRRGRRALVGAAAAVVLGIVVSAAVSLGWREAAIDGARARFDEVAASYPDRLSTQADRYVRALSVTRGYIAADHRISSQDFDVFTRSLDLERDFPGLKAMEFIEAGPDGTYPVVFVAPPTAATGRLGFDLAHDPASKEAIESVGSQGSVAFSPPSLDEWNRPRMLLVVPAHRDRRFVGWVGASLDPVVFTREALADLPEGIRSTLRWGSGGTVMGTVGAEDSGARAFSTTTDVSASGATFSVEVVATEDFAPRAFAFPWRVFGLSLLPAMVAAVVLYFVGRSRMQALILAERLGRDLAESEARASAVMNSAVEAILTADGEGRIETVNPAAEQLFGWSAEELTQRSLVQVLPSLDASGGSGDLDQLLWGPSEGMLNAHRKDGSVFPVDVSLVPTAVGERSMYILIARDATLRKLYEEQLTHQATHDPLTELANRNLFEELLVRAVYRGDRSRKAVAVAYIDLDGFKEVNDAFGHQAGDRVLAETARRLESVVRPGDIVARLGGDEFAILAENQQDEADAERIAERLVAAVARPIPVASGVAHVTASVGVAVSSLGEGATSLVERADQAMYEAKRAGKAAFRIAEKRVDASPLGSSSR